MQPKSEKDSGQAAQGQKDPLDKRTVQANWNGILRDVPALSETWCDRSSFRWVPYRPPPRTTTTDLPSPVAFGAVETWIERTSMVLEDLETLLLRTPDHVFWSHVLYDRSLHAHLGRILRRLPRGHEGRGAVQDDHPARTDATRMVEQVSGLVLGVFRRVLLPLDEQGSSVISPEGFRRHVYNNRVFDVPRIMDLCALFYETNPALVSSMMAALIDRSPKEYLADLGAASVTVAQALQKVQLKVEAVCIQVGANNHVSPDQTAVVADLADYAAEAAYSVSALVRALPPRAVDAFMGLSGPGDDGAAGSSEMFSPDVVAGFYQNALMPLASLVLMVGSGGEAAVTRVKLARHSCIQVFRLALLRLCPILEHPGLPRTARPEGSFSQQQQQQEGAEEFVAVLTERLGEPHFLLDYTLRYPIHADLDALARSGATLDPVGLEYLVAGIEGIQRDRISEDSAAALPSASSDLGAASEAPTKPLSTKALPGVAVPEMEDLIAQVRDLLPDLGRGFVRHCLLYYELNPETVINAVLEASNLPPHLNEMDRSLDDVDDHPPPESVLSDSRRQQDLKRLGDGLVASLAIGGDQAAAAASCNGGGAQGPSKSGGYLYEELEDGEVVRMNIYRKGSSKVKDCRDARDLLDDKRDLDGMRDRFASLGVVVVDHYGGDDYDDEYDDTYDDADVVNDNAADTYDDRRLRVAEREANEDDRRRGVDDMLERRPFVLPRALGGGPVRASLGGPSKDISSDDDEDDDEQKRKASLDFVRNPEEVRMEAERRRQDKMNRRQGARSFAASAGSRDVVGNPRGQGQDKQVLVNRARKNANKGKSNRAMADKKMSKGMF